MYGLFLGYPMGYVGGQVRWVLFQCSIGGGFGRMNGRSDSSVAEAGGSCLPSSFLPPQLR